jgi:hypothetical protein
MALQALETRPFWAEAPAGRIGESLETPAQPTICARPKAALLSCHRSVGWPPLPVLTVQRPPTFEIMRTVLKPVIAASAQAICARTVRRQAIVQSSQARSTRSTLAADLHPECSSWSSSKYRRTTSTSAETMDSTSLAADHQDHPGTPWKRADQQRGPQAPTRVIRHQCCPACRSWARRHSPPT